jgi:hypothetical protein
MNQLNNYRRVLSALCGTLFMVAAGVVKGQGKAEPSMGQSAGTQGVLTR